jgi:hypothetical protein
MSGLRRASHDILVEEFTNHPPIKKGRNDERKQKSMNIFIDSYSIPSIHCLQHDTEVEIVRTKLLHVVITFEHVHRPFIHNHDPFRKCVSGATTW